MDYQIQAHLQRQELSPQNHLRRNLWEARRQMDAMGYRIPTFLAWEGVALDQVSVGEIFGPVRAAA